MPALPEAPCPDDGEVLCALMFVLVLLQALALTSPPPPPTPAGPPRLLVLSPQTTTVDAAAVSTLTGALTAELARDKRLVVIAASDIADLADLEAEKQATGCDSNGCAAEIAGALGARYVLFGDINTISGVTVLNLRVIDTSTSAAIWRSSTQDASITRLADRVRPELRGAGNEIVAPGASTGSLLSVPAATQIAGLALISGGVVVGGLAVLGDVFSPTSTNGQLDGIDVLWPVLYVVAPAAIVVGTVMAITGGDAP